MTIIPLHGGPAPSDPVPDVVDLAERLLDRARSGDLRALAVATVAGPEAAAVGTEWAAAGGTRYVLAGTVMALHARIGADLVARLE